MTDRIISMKDVERIDPEDPRFITDTEFYEFTQFWAENFPDKVRRPEYIYDYLEMKYDQRRS